MCKECINLEKEIWEPIIGFEQWYHVSNQGRVLSLRQNKIMKTYTNNRGYVLIDLTANGVKTKTSVHRLVAKNFCEGYQKGLVVNHKDSDIKNNSHTNLEWLTQKENIHDTMRRGTFSISEAHIRANEVNKRKVQSLDPVTRKPVKQFDSLKEAREHLGGKPNICRALKEGTTAKGFLWEYI